MTYKLRITDVCFSLIEKMPDKRIQSKIVERIEALNTDPQKQGKRLVKKLAGFCSIHVAGRYRIIYKIDQNSSFVWIITAGIRKEGDQKDVYRIAKRLLKLGLIDHET